MVPTIRDVAARAGVSIATVSRVLNNSASVAETKRVRVLAAAEALGYRPNPNALGLKGQRTGGIGVLLPYIAGDFFSSFLQRIDRATSQTGQFLLAASAHRSIDEFRTVLHALDARVDGLIVMSTDIPARKVVGWLPPRVPIVFANTETTGADVASVTFDNRDGGRLAAEHLLDLGHRDIGFVTGLPDSWDARERRAGFVETLAAAGVALTIEVPGDYTVDAGKAAASAILASEPRPTAVFAANDPSACGLMMGLQQAGATIPDDVAVVGFDDDPEGRLFSPRLTSIRAPLERMGGLAIEQLAEQMRGTPPTVGETVLPVEIVVRESTAGA